MNSLKNALREAVQKADKNTPLVKALAWKTATSEENRGKRNDNRSNRKEHEINLAYSDHEAELKARYIRDVATAWREYAREQRQAELAMPIYLGA